MLAEKCPNCGAFLPVRQAGVTVRTCEFCGLEVPGAVVEVERLTTPRMAAKPPVAGRPRDGRGLAIAVPVVPTIAVVVLLAARGGPSGSAPPAATTVEAEAPLPSAGASAESPAEKPPARALREVIERAGGADAVDLGALAAYAETQVRALAPDALPILFNCTFVRADGRADLTLTGDARCAWEYRAPSRVKRPDGIPTGVRASVPCVLSFTAGASSMHGDVIERSYDLDDCRRWHALRPPRCTPSEIWERARAQGAPTDAVARLHLGARYRSPYDPVDPTDEADRPERGTWRLEIERDTGEDFRFETPDDCGQAPPSAVERAVMTAVERLKPALLACARRAAGKHDVIEAFEQTWRLQRDGARARVAFADPGVDIEGMFQGDLDEIRARWAACADAVAPRITLPASLPEVRLVLRVETGGRLTLAPPPFD